MHHIKVDCSYWSNYSGLLLQVWCVWMELSYVPIVNEWFYLNIKSGKRLTDIGNSALKSRLGMQGPEWPGPWISLPGQRSLFWVTEGWESRSVEPYKVVITRPRVSELSASPWAWSSGRTSLVQVLEVLSGKRSVLPCMDNHLEWALWNCICKGQGGRRSFSRERSFFLGMELLEEGPSFLKHMEVGPLFLEVLTQEEEPLLGRGVQEPSASVPGGLSLGGIYLWRVRRGYGTKLSLFNSVIWSRIYKLKLPTWLLLVWH